MPTIDPAADYVTFVNVFTWQPGDQAALSALGSGDPATLAGPSGNRQRWRKPRIPNCFKYRGHDEGSGGAHRLSV